MRERIRRQYPRVLWLGRIGALVCSLASLGMCGGVVMALAHFWSNPPSGGPPWLPLFINGIFYLQLFMSLAFLVSSLGILLFLHKIYPYYYCQMLRGITQSDFALLMAGEDIQRAMDEQWKERAFSTPMRPKLVSTEQHLESSALLFEAIYLHSRHQNWLKAMGPYRNQSRQVSTEGLYRWSWVTGLLLGLLVITFGILFIHLAILYCALAPRQMVSSARLAAFLDNYFGTPQVDPALIPPLERAPGYWARLTAPLTATLPALKPHNQPAQLEHQKTTEIVN